MSQSGSFYEGTGLPDVETITGDSGGPVGPDSSLNINLIGAGGAVVVGNPGTNTLTVSVSGGGVSWQDEAISFSAAVNTGYFVHGVATATLPAAPDQGDVVIINVDTVSTVTIQANTGQLIVLGNAVTSATAGTCTNTNNGDSITLVYRDSTATWRAISVIGLWGLS
jgi:hypothetical protein